MSRRPAPPTRAAAGFGTWRAPRVKEPGRLLTGVDHGPLVTVPPDGLAPAQRGGGWGPFADAFMRANRRAFEALDVAPQIAGSSDGVVLRLRPGARAGAIPLRSAQTGRVVGGFVVRPRFGWSGIGNVLTQTGWHASPEFLDEPLVPGSGREVPPWVLAGPVLARLDALLRSMRRGYRQVEEVLTRPRGRIIWNRYVAESLSRGAWEKMPCRFPELDADPILRRHVRWAVERIHRDLSSAGGKDPVALLLASIALRLVEMLADVTPLMPRRDELRRRMGLPRLDGDALRRGVEALAWIVEERGLGGGRELDGLAWVLPLDRLWESYVERVVRRDAAVRGGEVRVGRLRETTFPLAWSDPTHRSLGHLVPDIVVRRGRSVWVIDAKYKAHLAELDERGWHQFTDDVREAHRADVHQVLAYAALFEAEEITATLMYPLRYETWRALAERHRAISAADLLHGGRRLRLELRGIPFGSDQTRSSSGAE